VSNFRDRIVNEKAELDGRRERLGDFKNGSAFAALPWQEQERLNTQAHLMTALSAVLGERLATLPAAEPEQPASYGECGEAAATAESDGNVLARMGTDATKWADEFAATALRLGYSDMDRGWLIGWFANAIMAGHDSAQRNVNPAASDLGPVPELVATRVGDHAVRMVLVDSATAVHAYAIKAKARVEELERLVTLMQRQVAHQIARANECLTRAEKAEAALAAANERIEALLATGDEMDARIKELEREARERVAVNSALVRELAAANAKLASVREAAK